MRSYLVAQPRLAPHFCYSFYKRPPSHTHTSLYIRLPAKASVTFPTDANSRHNWFLSVLPTRALTPSPHLRVPSTSRPVRIMRKRIVRPCAADAGSMQIGRMVTGIGFSACYRRYRGSIWGCCSERTGNSGSAKESSIAIASGPQNINTVRVGSVGIMRPEAMATNSLTANKRPTKPSCITSHLSQTVLPCNDFCFKFGHTALQLLYFFSLTGGRLPFCMYIPMAFLLQSGSLFRIEVNHRRTSVIVNPVLHSIHFYTSAPAACSDIDRFVWFVIPFVHRFV